MHINTKSTCWRTRIAILTGKVVFKNMQVNKLQHNHWGLRLLVYRPESDLLDFFVSNGFPTFSFFAWGGENAITHAQ